MKDVQFNFSIEEANLVLNALANLPFQQVNGLITKLHAQANKQMQDIMEPDKVQSRVKENVG